MYVCIYISKNPVNQLSSSPLRPVYTSLTTHSPTHPDPRGTLLEKHLRKHLSFLTKLCFSLFFSFLSVSETFYHNFGINFPR